MTGVPSEYAVMSSPRRIAHVLVLRLLNALNELTWVTDSGRLALVFGLMSALVCTCMLGG